MGMRRCEVRARFDEIVEFSGVERFLDTPVKRYSTGMRLRLAFAVAAHLEPPIVVVDEVLAVGDSAFREKCMGKMAEMGRRDRTVLFVSHDLGAITRLCTRAVWLDGGRIRSDGTLREIVSSYLERATTPARVLDVEFDAEPDAAAAVQRVTVRDARTGQVLTAPERGSQFTIEMAVEVREAIPGLNVSIELFDEQGVKTSTILRATARLARRYPANRAPTWQRQRSHRCCGRAPTWCGAGSATSSRTPSIATSSR
jgi:lipopolysaccharide transport system ATP-binding protein